MVGAAGFEPTTSCPPDKRANRAAPRPDRNGADYRDAPMAVQYLSERPVAGPKSAWLAANKGGRVAEGGPLRSRADAGRGAIPGAMTGAL